VRDVPPGLLERRKEDALELSHDIVFKQGWNGQRESADALIEELKRYEQLRIVERARQAEQALFQRWGGVLDAKTALEEQLEDALLYEGVSRDDRTLVFTVLQDVDETVIGQERRVLAKGSRGSIIGTIASVSEREVVLEAERGDLNQVPMAGRLIVDRTMSQRAIEQQKRALTAIKEGSSVRGDLGTLLTKPETVRAPQPSAVDSYFHEDLDEPKKDAVRSALGSPDFTLVEGPPGTGKTTFIAEFICQVKARDPGATVLLSSQTHVAVDNAAVRFAELRPDLVVVRIGRTEKIGADAQALSVEEQLKRWRGEATERARAYLARWAEERGISPEAHRAYTDAQELELIQEKLLRLEGRFTSLDQDEDRILDRLTDPAVSSKGSGEASDLEDELAALQDEREVRAGEKAELEIESASVRTRLEEHLGVGSLDTIDVSEALRIKTPIESSDLDAFNTLTALQEEWLLRFGQGSEFTRALIDRADVVAGTCVGLASALNETEAQFDVAIVDEASKATPTETLVPMARSKQWLLVGDTRQLPPFVEIALEQSGFLEAHEISHDDLEETIFARLVDQLPSNVVRLTHQHRMLEPIGELISECFYGGLLASERGSESQFEAVRRTFPKPVTWQSTSRLPSREEQQIGTTFWNSAELQTIREGLRALQFYAEQLDEHLTVGVISAYAGQATELRRTLRREDAQWSHLKIDVNPVDSFQGQERDVIFYSVVRSNRDGNAGFLRSEERINVALSRGRDALIIVGDASFFEKLANSPLARALGHVRRASGCEVQELRA
jgi:hypothetical protein